MSAERPTFSPFWHRVRAMRPRLRPHVQITRQFYRGRRWHIVKDPSSNQFYRVNPIAHEFVGLFDGRRTVEEIWKITLDRHGDEAPTQQEAIQLISQLYNSNLLAADASPETDQLLRRGRDRAKQKAMQQAIGIMYFRVRVFNPDSYLRWIEPLLRPVLSVWGFVAWAALVLFALVQLLPEWERLVGSAEAIYSDPSLWPWMVAVFIVTKAIHETGHGVICKRFGGTVPEFGFMLLVLFPAPYVDASAAWAFENKWKRIAVGAGGMLFELFVAALAALVWLGTPEGSLVNHVAYAVIFTASVSTVLFNANPLMRFDGYFILSDLLEIPNLMQRSQNLLKHLCKRFIYGLKHDEPPTHEPTEWWTLLVYGLASLAYRVFLFITITLYVMGKLFAIGLALAVWTAAMWFILPVGKWVHWLATHGSLHDRRPRAIAASLALVLGGLALVGLIPAPDHRRAEGVVESLAATGVFFETDGFIEAAHVRIGDAVAKGDPIVTLTSADLESRYQRVRARIEELRAAEQEALGKLKHAEAQIAAERIRTLEQQLMFLQSKRDALIVRAPHDGRVVGQDPAQLVGAYAREGQAVCEVLDDAQLRVTALLDQHEAAWPEVVQLDELRVQMRLVSRAQQSLEGRAVRLIEAGQTDLPHPALGYAGGGSIETDATDRSGMRAAKPQFVMHVEPVLDAGPAAWMGLPGERVKLRFTLPSKPYLHQWVDRLHKLIQGKVDV